MTSANKKLRKEIAQECSRCLKAWGLNCLEPRITFEFSAKLRVSLGRTDVHARIVKLHPALETTARSKLKEVVCHEVAHICDYHLNGSEVSPHGASWQNLMLAAGYEPRTKITFSGFKTEQPNSQRKYFYRCVVCQSRRISSRRSQHFKCSACAQAGLPGEIVIEELR